MEFNEYQKKAWETAIYPFKGENIFYPALGLGEAGEVQNKVSKIMRDHNGKITSQMRKDLSKELGDLCWFIAAMCTELKISMGNVVKENIEKLQSRQERGKIQGSGDNR